LVGALVLVRRKKGEGRPGRRRGEEKHDSATVKKGRKGPSLSLGRGATKGKGRRKISNPNEGKKGEDLLIRKKKKKIP